MNRVSRNDDSEQNNPFEKFACEEEERHGGEIVAKLLMIPYVCKSTLLLLWVCNIISTFVMQKVVIGHF